MGGGATIPSDAEARPALTNVVIVLPVERHDLEDRGILQHLQKSFPHLRITYHHRAFGASELAPSIYRSADVLFTLFSLPPAPLSSTAPHLKWIHFFSAGVNLANDSPAWRDPSITLSTSSGTHGPQIAEWVIMTALVESHSFRALDRMRRHRQWGRESRAELDGRAPTDELGIRNMRDMVGQRIGILGYGSIGRQVGRVARAMGMTVVAYTASPRTSRESRRDAGYIVPGTGDAEGEFPSEWYSGLDRKSLHGFLGADLDFLVVTMPLTEQTRHALGTAEFEILSKRRAFVSNISRGQIIKQDDLIAALRSNDGDDDNDNKDSLLRGAALDVTDPEPLPAESPLWDLPNVIITPHVSGLSDAYSERTFAILELNLKRWETGEKLINVVDRHRGY
ncbi:MAG: hypothetical protein M1828_001097 [Chrysothrix sp. TS-e1954]|nr:MAG: hypothetical protein M1828_001097 [Chrysothrix sp. TS-e1954]